MIAKPKDFVVAVLLLLFSGVMYHESTVMDVGANLALGPLFFPRIQLFIIGGLSALLLVGSLRADKAATSAGAAAPADDAQKVQEPGGSRLLQWGLCALLVAYLLLLPDLGYATATVAFLLLGMVLLGPRKPLNLFIYCLVAAGVTFGLQFVFGTLLHLFLP